MYKRVIVATRNFECKATFSAESRGWSLEKRSSMTALYSAIEDLCHSETVQTILVAMPGAIRVEQSNASLLDDVPIYSDLSTPKPLDPAADVLNETDQANYFHNLQNYYQERNTNASLEPVWPTAPSCSSLSDNRWMAYADNILWEVLHYRLPMVNGPDEHKWWRAYRKISQLYADKIVSLYKEGDLVLINDFYLFLVPKLVRTKLPNAHIGFFLHVPFCTSEIFRSLPHRSDVLNGVLASNVIAFQTESSARHFISTCLNVLGLETTATSVDTTEGSRVAIVHMPVGINVSRMRALCQTESVQSKISQLRGIYGDEVRLLVGRDRLDRVCGVLHKLRAFRELLRRYPEWRNRVVLVEITSIPKNGDVGDMNVKVEDLITTINGEFGSLYFSPVHHFHQLIKQDEYAAILSTADVACVSSIRDSMNTMALEYVACQKENKGTLILSEFSGTSEVLSSALLVNPYDYAGFAKQMHCALSMSEQEREQRYASLWQQVSTNTSSAWITNLIETIGNQIVAMDIHITTPALQTSQVLPLYRKANKRLFLLDYDGTLIANTKNVRTPIPTDKLLRTLKRLAANPRNIVWVLSGRSKKFLDEWMGDISELGLLAEHGSYVRPPQSSKWQDLTGDMDLSWKDSVRNVLQYFTERTQGSSLDEKKASLLWNFANANTSYGKFQALECQTNLEGFLSNNQNTEVVSSKYSLEVHPSMLNKGSVIQRILNCSPKDLQFVFCAGDDKSDENMFEAIRDRYRNRQQNSKKQDTEATATNPASVSTFCIRIGYTDKPTLADYHLPSAMDLLQALKELSG
ncbi:trehalose-phosphate synthase Tps2 [Schizosaccharomyces japonicus yFS275]|uniref:Trehalose-phosphate synthase Tps2 n=1 Tax=Schizosaccharomyces japonicus (strain yFS275 / FY16936) TaxID=402676 RepID=B6JYI5_SCHJY|nr:trehalose-phosphate synthase Tps2 [Schizosaccharomyces japonicus yFS275]EEB06603.1 trehalose-phosphate synthase Tps2 [Schizosaccharomyces japonicus yFS275]